METVELSCGTIEYLDTGGDGRVLVFGHGVPMNGSQWRKVVPLLAEYRCLLPTLPLGAHRLPMRPGVDLSHRGVALILAEFLERLDLEDVTLILNDWGGGQFVVSEGRAERVARLVLVACEAFDNFPPPPARPLALVCRVPGVVWLLAVLMSVPAVRHHPRGYGGMSCRGIPDEVLDQWFTPLRRSRAVRRDFARFSTSTPARSTLLSWSERLPTFDRPVLVVWAENDTMMPREHGPRLAALYPRAKFVEVADSATLVPEDQPEVLAGHLREFLARPTGPSTPGQ